MVFTGVEAERWGGSWWLNLSKQSDLGEVKFKVWKVKGKTKVQQQLGVAAA